MPAPLCSGGAGKQRKGSLRGKQDENACAKSATAPFASQAKELNAQSVKASTNTTHTQSQKLCVLSRCRGG